MENEKREITELEEELKKFSPVQSQISRDDLFFKAGLASANEQVRNGKQLRLWQSYSAVMTLSTLVCFGWILQGVVSTEPQPGNHPVANVPSSVPAEKIPRSQKNHLDQKEEVQSVILMEPSQESYLSLTRLYLKNLEEGKRPENLLESDTESPRPESSFQYQQPESYRDLMEEMIDSRGDSQI